MVIIAEKSKDIEEYYKIPEEKMLSGFRKYLIFISCILKGVKTRLEICKKSNYSHNAIGICIKDLKEYGVIRATGLVPSDLNGRRKKVWSLTPNWVEQLRTFQEAFYEGRME